MGSKLYFTGLFIILALGFLDAYIIYIPRFIGAILMLVGLILIWVNK